PKPLHKLWMGTGPISSAPSRLLYTAIVTFTIWTNWLAPTAPLVSGGTNANPRTRRVFPAARPSQFMTLLTPPRGPASSAGGAGVGAAAAETRTGRARLESFSVVRTRRCSRAGRHHGERSGGVVALGISHDRAACGGMRSQQDRKQRQARDEDVTHGDPPFLDKERPLDSVKRGRRPATPRAGSRFDHHPSHEKRSRGRNPLFARVTETQGPRR